MKKLRPKIEKKLSADFRFFQLLQVFHSFFLQKPMGRCFVSGRHAPARVLCVCGRGPSGGRGHCETGGEDRVPEELVQHRGLRLLLAPPEERTRTPAPLRAQPHLPPPHQDIH